MKDKIHQSKISSEKVIIVSFLVDISDVLINFIIAFLSGSVVMLSQTLQGAADLLASGFLVVGEKSSKRPSDKRHPFGYGRELYFWTFLSSLVTFIVTSGMSFYYGFRRFISPEPIENISFVFIALIIGVITNGYSMSLSFRRLLGRNPLKSIWKTFISSALIATKTVLVLDIMGTIASLLGLLSISLYVITGNYSFDGIGSMAIGITLAILALFIIKGAKDLLVGQSASPEVEEKIRKVAEADSNVHKVLDLRTLQIGVDKLLINIEINLADELTTDEIEILIDKIEKEIKEEVPSASHIQIELETPDV